MSRNESDVKREINQKNAPQPRQNAWVSRKFGLGFSREPVLVGARGRSRSDPPPKLDPLEGVDVNAWFQQLEREAGQVASLQAKNHRPVDAALQRARNVIQGGDRPAAHTALRELEGAIAAVRRLADSRAESVKTRQKYQGDLAERIETRAALIKQGAFASGEAKRLEKELGTGGSEFKRFLKAQAAIEAARTPQTLGELKVSAEAYLAHVEKDFSDKKQQDKDRQRKVAACTDALRRIRLWELADEQQKLGSPPWDPATEHRAGGTLAKMLFEEGDIPARRLDGGESGLSGAWWIERAGGTADSDKRDKQFLFKPMDVENVEPGFEPGSGAQREVLTKTINDRIASMSGLDFGAPPCFMVGIANEKLHDTDGTIDQTHSGQQRFGSMQQFAKNDGTAQALAKKDPQGTALRIKNVPKRECHKLALFDLITLNSDRHQGNVMFDGQGDDTKLVPIDHGLALPTREGLTGRIQKLGPAHSVVAQMDARNEKLDPDMLASLRMIDPDELVKAVQESSKGMRALGPGAGNFDPTEATKLMKRSIEFLQAAGGELTISEIMNAYVSDTQAILDCPENEKQQRFAEVIGRAREEGAATREIDQLFPDAKARAQLSNKLYALGWTDNMTVTDFEKWLVGHARIAIRVHKSGIENPAVRREVDKLVEELGGYEALTVDIADKPLPQQIELLQGAKAKQRLEEQKDRLLGFGVDGEVIVKSSKADVEKLGRYADDYHAFGGDGGLTGAGVDPKGLSFEERAAKMYEKQVEALGGKKAYDALVQRFPNNAVGNPNAENYRKMVENLKALAKYEQLGGDREYFRVGGDGEIASVQIRLAMMEREAIREREAANEVIGKDPAVLRATELQRRLARLRKDAQSLPDNERNQAAAPLQEADRRLVGGEHDEAGKELDKVDVLVNAHRKQLAALARRDEAVGKRLQAVYDLMNEVRDQQQKRQLTMAYRNILTLKDEKRFDECEQALTTLEQDAKKASGKG